MFNFFKENRKMLIVFLVIAIVFPIIILCPSPIGIIPYETGLTIVGYGGSILGGFLTLYGVWWTIEDNNKQKKEELKLQYRPIIQIKSYHEKNFLNKRKHLVHLLFKITNIGRGEICECSITTKIYLNHKITINSDKITHKNNYFEILAPLQEEVYELLFELPKNLISEEILIDVLFNINGYDLFNDQIKIPNKIKHLVINKNQKILRRIYSIKNEKKY